MVSKKFLDISEKKIKELEKKDNEYIAKAFVKDRKDFDKGLAKAIVKRWNQKLNNENLKDYTEAAIISPQGLPEERLEHISRYDIEEWLGAGCSLPLSTYKLKSQKKFILKVRNYNEHQMLNEVTKDWTARARSLFYFRQVVSSNHRRFIEKLSDRSPLPISKDDLSISAVSGA